MIPKAEDVAYVVKMGVVVATFPIALPILFLIDFITLAEAPYDVFTPPWTRRKIERENIERHQREEEEAHRKTYAYRYSQQLHGL
jgi:hypothetical protein